MKRFVSIVALMLAVSSLGASAATGLKGVLQDVLQAFSKKAGTRKKRKNPGFLGVFRGG